VAGFPAKAIRRFLRQGGECVSAWVGPTYSEIGRRKAADVLKNPPKYGFLEDHLPMPFDDARNLVAES